MLDVRGLFAASDSVERDEFSKYVDGTDLRRRYPGEQAVGYLERVDSEEKDEFETEVREEGPSDYTLLPDGERYEYFPIVYIEPSDGPNQRLFGYDTFAKRTQRAAMERARDTGLPAVSGRVALSGEDGEEGTAGFLIYLPVYRDGEPQQTAPEHRSALQGFVISVFRADELLEGIFGGRQIPTSISRSSTGRTSTPSTSCTTTGSCTPPTPPTALASRTSPRSRSGGGAGASTSIRSRASRAAGRAGCRSQCSSVASW